MYLPNQEGIHFCVILHSCSSSPIFFLTCTSSYLTLSTPESLHLCTYPVYTSPLYTLPPLYLFTPAGYSNPRTSSGMSISTPEPLRLSPSSLELGIETRIVLLLTRATLRLSCPTVEHGARVIKQNRRGSFRSVDMAGLAV